MSEPIKVFISYSHQDDELRQELVKHLSGLEKSGLIEPWTDRDIAAGTDWEKQINENLERADIVLFLVSSDFISSRYCYSVEMNRALERYRAGSARCIPVIIRACDWLSTPLKELGAIPWDNKPVAARGDKYARDEAWLEVVQEIRKVAQHLEMGQPAVATQPDSPANDEPLEDRSQLPSVRLSDLRGYESMSDSPSIFISYRRKDSEDIADRIYDRLKDHFGAESVFFDIDSILLGIDFEECIDNAVSQCQIFLAIIGKNWLSVTDAEGNRRLDSESDFVRLEIESALRRKIPVIPLLVGRAEMPSKSELPESIRKLSSRNGAQVRSGKDFHKDIDDLIKGIEAHFNQAVSSFPAAPVVEPSSISAPEPSEIRLERFSFEVVTVDRKGKMKDRRTESTEHFLEDLGNGITLDMVRIPGGEFLMGSPKYETGRLKIEGPQHIVKVPEFFIGKYLVTQRQWYIVANLHAVDQELSISSSQLINENNPVEKITWKDAVEFCQRLSILLGREYRLPSESEWEYACRAGTNTPFYFGRTITSKLANYCAAPVNKSNLQDRDPKQTTEVGTFPANIFGLYDMHGNLWEWCADTWHPNYGGAPIDGSAWEKGGDISKHVVRGGSWNNSARFCRSACRDVGHSSGSLQGFRVALCSPNEWQ